MDNGCRHHDDCLTCPFEDCIALDAELVDPRVAYLQEYYQKNKEKKIAYSREYYQRNKEKWAGYRRKYTLKNKEKRAA